MVGAYWPLSRGAHTLAFPPSRCIAVRDHVAAHSYTLTHSSMDLRSNTFHGVSLCPLIMAMPVALDALVPRGSAADRWRLAGTKCIVDVGATRSHVASQIPSTISVTP